MTIFQDVEGIIESITNTSTPQASAEALLAWIIGGLQGALNAPDQHAQLQTAVNTLKAQAPALAAAVAAEPAQ